MSYELTPDDRQALQWFTELLMRPSRTEADKQECLRQIRDDPDPDQAIDHDCLRAWFAVTWHRDPVLTVAFGRMWSVRQKLDEAQRRAFDEAFDFGFVAE
jgi:hypothetical protein